MQIILTEKVEVKTHEELVVSNNTDLWLGKQMVEYWNASNPNSPYELKLVTDEYVPYKKGTNIKPDFEISGEYGTNLNKRLLKEIIKLRNLGQKRTDEETKLLNSLRFIRNTELGLLYKEGIEQENLYEETHLTKEKVMELIDEFRNLIQENSQINVIIINN